MSLLKLHPEVDPQAGFCFGVVYAIEMAEQVLDREGKLYCLGDIEHNDEEVKRLKAKGLRIISQDDLHHLQNEKVLIRAHGESPLTYALAHKRNIKILDASCPVVLKLQESIHNASKEDAPIYIYGKPTHPEVIGLIGQVKNAVVFQDIEEIDIKCLPRKLILYSQTTKSVDKFYETVRIFKKRA